MNTLSFIIFSSQQIYFNSLYVIFFNSIIIINREKDMNHNFPHKKVIFFLITHKRN